MFSPFNSRSALSPLRQRDVFHRHWASLRSRDDGKVYPCRGNPYRFSFAIQPEGQPLVMLGARTGTTSLGVRDDVAGLAEPRLIEWDHAMFGNMMPHQSIPHRKNNNCLPPFFYWPLPLPPGSCPIIYFGGHRRKRRREARKTSPHLP